jgi:hypothetical protein
MLKMKCKICGHTHKEKDCRAAYCAECDVFGDLTQTPKDCDGMKELNKKIAMFFGLKIKRIS